MSIHIEVSVEIAAPAERIWAATMELEHWPDWNPVVTALKRLDSGLVKIGSRARIWQPRLLPAIWRVTRCEPLRAFVWENKLPGAHTIAEHLIAARQENPPVCVLTLRLWQKGFFIALLRPMVARLSLRYAQMEAQGLKSYCEKMPS